MLQYLRWGNHADRKTKLSWMLSFLMLLALGGMWFFSTSAPAQGVDDGSILLACCCVVAVVVAIGNGRLQMSIKDYGFKVRGERGPEQSYGGHGRHGGHRGSHGWMGRPRGLGTVRPSFADYGTVAARGQRMEVFPWREAMVSEASTPRRREVASSQPSAQMSSVCISNCKACNEPVCVRSGTARNRRSIG